jgi:hypothetical protein
MDDNLLIIRSMLKSRLILIKNLIKIKIVRYQGELESNL